MSIPMLSKQEVSFIRDLRHRHAQCGLQDGQAGATCQQHHTNVATARLRVGAHHVNLHMEIHNKEVTK